MAESEFRPISDQSVDAPPPQNTAGSLPSDPPKNPPAPLEIYPSPEDKKQSQYCRPDQTPLTKLVMEAVALVVGLSAVLIYGCQLGVMNKQLIDSETATKNAAETQILSNMALIFPTGVTPNLEALADGSRVIRIHQEWKDAGETRAVGPKIEWGWGPEIPTHSTKYQRIFDHWKNSTWVKEHPFSDDAEIPLDEGKRLAELKTPLYLYGKVRYDDVFPVDRDTGHERKDHLIEYCIRIVKFNISENGASWSGMDCERGDCVDEQCPVEDYPKK